MAYGYNDPLRSKHRRDAIPVRPAPVRDSNHALAIAGYFSQCPSDVKRLYVDLLRALRPRGACKVNGAIHQVSRKGQQGGVVERSTRTVRAWLDVFPELASDVGIDTLFATAPGLWGLSVETRPGTNYGLDHPISTTLNFQRDWFDRWCEEPAALPTIERAIEAFALDKSCFQAIICCDYYQRIYFTSFYSEFLAEPLCWSDYVDYVEWRELGKQREQRLQSVEWGNYLGPALAAKLPKDFERRYLTFETPEYGVGSQIVRRYPGGGLFITVSNDPFEILEEHPEYMDTPMVRNAIWLRREYRKAGIF